MSRKAILKRWECGCIGFEFEGIGQEEGNSFEIIELVCVIESCKNKHNNKHCSPKQLRHPINNIQSPIPLPRILPRSTLSGKGKVLTLPEQHAKFSRFVDLATNGIALDFIDRLLHA